MEHPLYWGLHKGNLEQGFFPGDSENMLKPLECEHLSLMEAP
jgi:hypothetical protein